VVSVPLWLTAVFKMIGPRLLERLIEQEHEQEDVLDVFEGILIFIGPVLQRGANET